MKREILVCGVLCGVLAAVLRWTEYRFLIVEHAAAIYGGMIAAVFAGLGIWLGVRLAGMGRRRTAERQTGTEAGGEFAVDERKRLELGITPRELEVLGLIARGMSTREMADALHVSENTVKTHSSRVLDKLGARRRTQAVQLGKELGLLG